MNSNHLEKKMLIVSNNPLSRTSNNGKTIASFIDGIAADRIRQLYFNKEQPSIGGYSYFQLSDLDILKGYFLAKKRGRKFNDLFAEAQPTITQQTMQESICVKRNGVSRMMREVLWAAHWKSPQLLAWLDEFQPDVVFFVAGDSGFAYAIVKFIVKRYHCRLVTYITDDYIMPRSAETLIAQTRRRFIRRKMLEAIQHSEEYFTISTLMQDTYESLSGKRSHLLMNLTPSLYLEDEQLRTSQEDTVTFIYTGSLYYNRDKTIGMVADAAAQYNSSRAEGEKPIKIKVYCNREPSKDSKRLFERESCCSYCGSLNPEELKVALNRADVLLFVESFDQKMREKTRYSLSTKVPEYMSVGKPIFAVGPEDIGSMRYLSDVAFCAYSSEELANRIQEIICDSELVKQRVHDAMDKFQTNHDPVKSKETFMDICMQ